MRCLGPTTVLVAAFVGLVACTGESGVVARGSEVVTTPPPPPPTTEAPQPDGDPVAVFEAVSSSIAFVETPHGTGSGVLVADGWVITNAHVVDPFATAALTFEGMDTITDVPVVGVDVFADIAVLGPLDVDRPGLSPLTAADLPRGSTVFLVGHPGARPTDLDLTITQGILSRRQRLEALGATMLQSDALIAGGQSGGALLDEDGHLIGISGAVVDGFSISLDGAEVRAAADAIIGGERSPMRPLDDRALVESFSFDTTEDEPTAIAVIPPADEERTIEIAAVADDGTPVRIEAVGTFGFHSATDDEFAFAPMVPIAPDRWELDLPANEAVRLELSTGDGFDEIDGTPLGEPGKQIDVESTVPLLPYADTDGTTDLAAGADGRHVLDAFEERDDYLLDLVDGSQVEIAAHSLFGDLVIEVEELEGEFSMTVDDDLDDGGWFGLDPVARFTAPSTGRYRVEIRRAFPTFETIGYRLTVATS